MCARVYMHTHNPESEKDGAQKTLSTVRWQSFCPAHENKMLFFAKSKSTFVRGYHFICCTSQPHLDLFIPLNTITHYPPHQYPQEAASKGTESP